MWLSLIFPLVNLYPFQHHFLESGKLRVQAHCPKSIVAIAPMQDHEGTVIGDV